MSTTSGEHSPRFSRTRIMPLGQFARRGRLALIDAGLIAAATTFALILAIQEADTQVSVGVFALVVGIAFIAKLPPLFWSTVYDVEWSRANAWDLVILARAIILGSVVLTVTLIAISTPDWSAVVLVRFALVDLFLTGTAVASSRVGVRIITELRMRKRDRTKGRVLIVGAGDAGAQVARALAEEVGAGFVAVGFVDDDPRKAGRVVHGIRVRGPRSNMSVMVSRLNVSEIWVAMPSAPENIIQETIRIGRDAGITQIKVVPGFSTLVSGVVRLTDMREVQIEELLGRDPVTVDTTQVSTFLEGKTILVTGGAGSIGSELCTQISQFSPGRLVVLDQDETGVFNTMRALAAQDGQTKAEAVVGDVRDKAEMDDVFRHFKPHVVFHAAAYKHVPLMEEQPDRAVKTNVFGTQTVAKAAQKWGAEKFVMISTDKAVNPTSIMGATKRAAELLVKEMGKTGNTGYVSVRFGNVLGSRGSVVPIFKEQIAKGGPITVTDPEMQRYFMTIPEAVLLVLQAGAMGDNGQVFVLDMGEPVRIVDLARQMISLSGLEPDKDISIVFTGARPGEKMFEDILSAEEGTSATNHDRIFVARARDVENSNEVERGLEALSVALNESDSKAVIAAIRDLVVTYRPESPTTPIRDAQMHPALAD